MSTSRKNVNIYDYPEHLNPFYEEDVHNRIRFWDRGKKFIRSENFSFSDFKSLPRRLKNPPKLKFQKQWVSTLTLRSFRSKTKTDSDSSPKTSYYSRKNSRNSSYNYNNNNTAKEDIISPPPRASSSLGICETEVSIGRLTPTPPPRTKHSSGTLPRKKRRAPPPPQSPTTPTSPAVPIIIPSAPPEESIESKASKSESNQTVSDTTCSTNPFKPEETKIEDVPKKEEDSKVDQAPKTEGTPKIEEAPKTEETPKVVDVPKIEQTPKVVDVSKTEEAPKVIDVSKKEETSKVKDVCNKQDAPTVEVAITNQQTEIVKEEVKIQETQISEDNNYEISPPVINITKTDAAEIQEEVKNSGIKEVGNASKLEKATKVCELQGEKEVEVNIQQIPVINEDIIPVYYTEHIVGNPINFNNDIKNHLQAGGNLEETTYNNDVSLYVEEEKIFSKIEAEEEEEEEEEEEKEEEEEEEEEEDQEDEVELRSKPSREESNLYPNSDEVLELQNGNTIMPNKTKLSNGINYEPLVNDEIEHPNLNDPDQLLKQIQMLQQEVENMTFAEQNSMSNDESNLDVDKISEMKDFMKTVDNLENKGKRRSWQTKENKVMIQ